MRQPVFGRGVNPGLGLADFSGIERGGAAMGSGMAMGLASLGAGMEKGRAEKHDMEKQVRQAEATLKTLEKRENLDDGLRQLAIGYDDQLANPNLSLRERAAIAGTVNENIDRVIQLGAAQMQKQQAEEQSQMRQLQIQQAQQDQAMGQQTMEEERRMLQQLSQNQQGIGSGVLRPEVTAGLSEINRSNPQAAFAARQGISLDAAERFVPPSASENQLNLTKDPETGSVIATYGNNMQVINLRDAGSELRETRLYNAMLKAREEGDAEAESLYSDVLEKMRAGQQLDPVTMRMLSLTNPELFAELIKMQQRPRNQANTGSSKGTPQALPDPAAARESVNNRLFGR
jgi:F0F1-type ATP synthase membrane subunit c/vacuolar-type H+-ATPase subunit K